MSSETNDFETDARIRKEVKKVDSGNFMETKSKLYFLNLYNFGKVFLSFLMHSNDLLLYFFLFKIAIHRTSGIKKGNKLSLYIYIVLHREYEKKIFIFLL